jgi:3-phosphoshikimate 1-carboxyvinyltransferase
MERIAEPLRLLGADVETRGGTLPMRIRGSRLQAIDYQPPVASAQVKSAVLLAGLQAQGRTTVREPIPTRDHTELMLEAAGARVVRRPGSVTVEGGATLRLPEVFVPGDFSSAAPFVVAATLIAGSELTIHDIGLNPRRTGLLDVLDRMGGRVTVFNRRRIAGEQIGDLEVRSAELTATEIGPGEVPALIDELPLFAVLAAHARGESVVRGAEELRTKESDRIDAVTTGLRALGVHITATPDGYRVRGVPARPRGGGMRSEGDHRIAMVGAVAGLASREGVEIEGAEAVAVSFPGFFELLDSISRR